MTLALIGSLVVYIAPAYRNIRLANGYTIHYFNTPDGDFDRDWVIIARPDSTLVSFDLDPEAYRCWPTPIIQTTTLRFRCSAVDYFCTCDDRFLRKARTHPAITIMVVSPL